MSIPKSLILAALFACGCAGTALRPDTAVSDDEIRELKARVVELQRKATVSEVELARLRDEVAALRGGTSGARGNLSSTSSAPTPPATSRRPSTISAPPPAPAPAPPPTPISSERGGDVVRERREPAMEEVDIPEPDRPAVAPKTAPAPKTSSTPPAPRPSATRPKAQPQSSVRVVPPPPSASSAPVPAPPPPISAAAAPGPVVSGPGESAETLPPAAQALYDRGYTLYHQGRYVDAEASFQRFLQMEPKSELADNALYWIGECRYSRNDMKGALAAFRETVERYPQGNKVPDALLKAGQTMEALGDTEGARNSYKEVSKRFPNTAAAAAAEERRSKLP